MDGYLERGKTLLARWLPFLPVSRHRKILAWLRSRGYRAAEVLSWGKAYRVEKKGERFVFKCLSPQGIAIWKEVLWNLQGPFRRLAVPRAIALGQDKRIGGWVLREWLDGTPMCAEWSELLTPGDFHLPKDRIEKIMDLLEDLATIDASRFLTANIQRRDPQGLQEQIHRELTQAEQNNLLTQAEIQKTWQLVEPVLACEESGPWRLSNHDFYFRNFLELPDGRVALLDWEVARISCFEIEHCTSYLWMLLWNQPEWRTEFLLQAKRRLGIGREKFRAALVVNALHQAMFTWQNQPTLQKTMLTVLQEALDDRRFSEVWALES